MTEENGKNLVAVSVVGCESASEMAAVSPEAHRITVERPFMDLFYELKAADTAGIEKVVVPIPADMPNLNSDSINAIGIMALMFVRTKPSSVRSIIFVVAGNPRAFQAILDQVARA